MNARFPSPCRRLLLGLRAAAGLLLVQSLILPLLGDRGSFDTREAFDAMLARVPAAQIERDNEAGGIAWGTSYYMGALVSMYQASGDTLYLDRLIATADRVLEMRDSVTGATDYQGISHPGWTAGAHYSIGEITLKDLAGRPALYLRTAFYGYNNETEVTVSPGETEGAFDLRIRNPRYDREVSFEGLSLDPESPSYAPEVIGRSEMAQPFDRARLAVRGIGEDRNHSISSLAPGQFHLEPSRYLWPVHQGMATYPMVAFARLVCECPELRENPRFLAKAEEYTRATVAIMEVLESDWRENDQGEGWYSVERGAPVWLDGLDEPHNHFLAVGRAMVHLAAVTGEERWHDRAEKMARTFRNDLSVQENGTYVWSYWWSKGFAYNGWAPEEDVSENTPALPPVQMAEDYSHGSIDVHFAWLCYRDGIAFERKDMQRLAATFTKNLLSEDEEGRDTLHERVDGTGRLSHHDQRGPEWVLLAEFDPEVFRVFRELREDQPWSGNLVQLLASGNLNLLALRGLGEKNDESDEYNDSSE